MQKKSSDFSMQEAQRLAGSPAGKALLAQLQNANSPALQQAVKEAEKGNLDQARLLLEPLLSSPEIRELIGRLGE